MPSHTFRLVLLVSFAHAMVHMFEHALPAVEQMIGDDFGVSKSQTGALGTAWRLPLGMGALLAGYLTDRFGSKRMLMVYLLGCNGDIDWCVVGAKLVDLVFNDAFNGHVCQYLSSRRTLSDLS